MSIGTTRADYVIDVFNALQKVCYENSKAKGFWTDQDVAITVLRNASFANGAEKAKLIDAVNNAFYAMKGDLMHSELGERTEAQRKSLPSDKLSDEFSGEEEELADTIIRIFDYAGRRNMKLGQAIVLKIGYNADRPYLHGKEF